MKGWEVLGVFGFLFLRVGVYYLDWGVSFLASRYFFLYVLVVFFLV